MSEARVGSPGGSAGDPAGAGAWVPTPSGRQVALAAGLERTRIWCEAGLESVLAERPDTPEPLAEALRYTLLGGGKRLRPALVRMWCEELGGSAEQALWPALAVECIHGYSLVHDDLPCMDDDDLRRGRPTVHRVYGYALGILVGDALQALAFELAARAPPAAAAELCAALARAAGRAGMVGGQVLDLELSGRKASISPDEVRRTHRLKTAALIAAACELGAIAAGAEKARLEHVRAYGNALGLCFQAVDDCLDVTGDARALGKTPGKDERLERGTLVAVLGLAGARAEALERARAARAAALGLGLSDSSRPVLLVEHLLARGA